MADRESVNTFLTNIKNWNNVIQWLALNSWNQNTELAKGESVRVAPKRKGTLQRSARLVRAKITDKGIVSSFIFGVPYAYDLEKGERNGKELNIRTTVNPNAQKGYGARGVKTVENDLIDDLKTIVSRSFGVM